MRFLTSITRVSRRLVRQLHGSRAGAQRGPRLCRVEAIEPRLTMTGDLHVGAVYFEGDLGADTEPDRIEITFAGGAPGTQATRLVIDGDKDGNGLSVGDLFFDTQPGGLGSFNSAPLAILAHDGFDILATSVADGGTLLTIDVRGMDPGEKLLLSIDVDELQYVDPNTGEQDTNAVVEGAEFQRARLIASLAAPHFFDVTGTARFFDHYDDNFASARQQAGSQLDLPPDSFGSGEDRSDRTAGAVVVLPQTPLPITIAGTVFEDVDLDNSPDAGEGGIAGVSLALEIWNGSAYASTGQTAQTNSVGDFKFEGLLPGKYRIVETQPSGYVSVGATAGHVGSQTRGVVAGPDVLSEIELLGGEDSLDNDFAEARPVSLAGNVYHDRNNNGLLQAGEEGIRQVTIRVIPLQTVGTPRGPVDVQTAADGSWLVGGLNPGSYRVIEVAQPLPYLDGLDAAGSAGGTAVNPGDEIGGIRLLSGRAGINYNFGEILPNRIAGRVHADANGNCEYEPGDQLLSGVRLRLLDASGAVVATTLTNSQGQYEFTGLRPGVYTVVEEQPAGYIDGEESVGSAGGVIAANDTIAQIAVVSGANAVDYNFCEHVLLNLSGYVYVDENNNGLKDRDEPGIGGVSLRLLDASGNPTDRTATTAADGSYHFTGLLPGKYGVAETQPAGFLDGLDAPGNAGGAAENPGDRILGAMLMVGLNGENYNFGELRPSSLSGRVHADLDDDCELDANETPLAGVRVHLLDSAGNVLHTVVTDAQGRYRFENLRPGSYTVREDQPSGYFDGREQPGSHGGRAPGDDTLTDIVLGAGVSAVDYDFCELPPGSIAGRVHADLDEDCELDNGETPLSGVRINLINERGEVVQTVTTDVQGRYRFANLAPGQYRVREEQPDGYFDGDEHPGTSGGQAIGDDTIAGIRLLPGVDAQDYDFCEIPPTAISGYVYHDRNNNGQREAGEEGIGNVEILLKDADGNPTGARTTTAADGSYRFEGLRPGTYGVGEIQPGGWLDGADAAGTSGGTAVNPGDMIMGAVLRPAVEGLEYNFGELAPASLRGTVHADTDGNCQFDVYESGIAGVVIRLLDSSGQAVATSTTNAQGQYEFAGLRPGRYTVVEEQPSGYFDGGEDVGSHGGAVSANDTLSGIELGSAAAAVGYHFCELPPAAISGYVFQDGAPIPLPNSGQLPDLDRLRDGRLTGDDRRLEGVRVELRDGRTGEAILGSRALPGTYAADRPIATLTDAAGFFQFVGLPPGRYAVFEVQPENYVDGRDTAGTASGIPVNPSDEIAPAILQELTVPHNHDAILRIFITAGQHSQDNWFSEVVTFAEPIPLPQLPPDPPEQRPINALRPPIESPRLDPRPVLDAIEPRPYYSGSSPVRNYTWHLSVVNAGMPRGAEQSETVVKFAAARSQEVEFRSVRLDGGEWILEALGAGGTASAKRRKIRFGMAGSRPVTGDFNGDGVTDVGIFFKGQWFIDLNGNGQWDDDDLWAKLGSDQDRPVTGDWDGDGKDDIGIYGPAWPGDPHAVEAEPGIPDPYNARKNVTKNLPPEERDAARGVRTLKLTSHGRPRADLIDHVFHYGSPTDVPIVGDWNGDGIDTIAVFRDGGWYRDADGDGRWSDADLAARFGQPGDKPIVGDFDGDGIDEIGVFREGVWYIDINHNGAVDADDLALRVGGPGDQPVVGDWDGDGRDEPGVYRDGATLPGGRFQASR